MNAEGALLKPGEFDVDLRERLETLKKYANAEIDKCNTFIQEQEKELQEYLNLRKKVTDFPQKLRREDWLPINDYAFIRGTYDNTNKFYTLLGSQYIAERSAVETVEFIDRIIKAINDAKEGYEKQKELAKSRLEFAENLFEQEKSDIVEIREPFDAEILKVKKQPKVDRSHDDFEEIMARLDELEKEENDEDGNDTVIANESEEAKDQCTVEVKNEIKNEKFKLVAPKGVPQEEFEQLIKRVDEMIESSDDEEDYEAEDLSDEAEENVLDSDDSLPENSMKQEVTKEETKQITPQPKITVSSSSKKSGVRFSSELEAGPTVASSEQTTFSPRSILRNKNEKTPVNELAVKAMNEVEPERKILPATDAFKGVFVERNPHTLEPSTSEAAIADLKKPVSKFKAKRMNL